MNVVRGDMWSVWQEPNTLFCITTNAVVRRDGELVMGRGIAKGLHDRGYGAWAGRLVSDWQAKKWRGDYGFLYGKVKFRLNFWIGLFQVKRHYREKADVNIIRRAAIKLCDFCGEYPSITVNLNYPGIGWGGLKVDEVAPLLEILPDQVYIWRFEWEES